MLFSTSCHDVLSCSWTDGFGHIQDFRFPVVFPSGFGPKQALISDSKGHVNKIINFNIQKQQKSFSPLIQFFYFVV